MPLPRVVDEALNRWRLIRRHMHQISDGERRRVQLCMGLMGEWDVLLLDEVSLQVLICMDSAHGPHRSRSTWTFWSDLT